MMCRARNKRVHRGADMCVMAQGYQISVHVGRGRHRLIILLCAKRRRSKLKRSEASMWVHKFAGER